MEIWTNMKNDKDDVLNKQNTNKVILKDFDKQILSDTELFKNKKSDKDEISKHRKRVIKTKEEFFKFVSNISDEK